MFFLGVDRDSAKCRLLALPAYPAYLPLLRSYFYAIRNAQNEFETLSDDENHRLVAENNVTNDTDSKDDSDDISNDGSDAVAGMT